jgi:drug/metabolite transporter (DMT)-like permease
MNGRRIKLSSIVLALLGVIFLIGAVYHFMQGEPLSLTPALAAAIGLFLGAIVSHFLNRKPGDSSGPPSA